MPNAKATAGMNLTVMTNVRFVIPTEANPDFLLRGATNGRVCGFPYRKPHEVRQRNRARQEIRGSGVEGSAVFQPGRAGTPGVVVRNLG